MAGEGHSRECLVARPRPGDHALNRSPDEPRPIGTTHDVTRRVLFRWKKGDAHDVETAGYHLDIPIQRINELVRGKRRISPETAWLSDGAPGTTPEFWINLQTNHDLVKGRPKRKVRQVAAAG